MRSKTVWNRGRVLIAIWFLFFGSALPLAPGDAREGRNHLAEILRYISSGWDSLTRSMTRCDSVADTKSAQKAVLYLPAQMPIPQALEELQRNCPVRIERLPSVIVRAGQLDMSQIQQHGLLYLEHPYVVPGGFFNEMYGWDSYFILRGLLRDGRVGLAQGIVENFFFEIEHYGMILNSNRTYHLTRSQPPFLTAMVLAIHEAQKAAGREDLAWLARGYAYAAKDYEFWMREPHLAGSTGLSRYYDFAEGPAPEVLSGAGDYYRYAVRYSLQNRESAGAYLARTSESERGRTMLGPVFSVYLCDPQDAAGVKGKCELIENVGLTAEFYKGDRAMRASGFDISHRFGPLSGSTHHFAPVCLNSLLYKAEKDLENISSLLGRKADATKWRERARQRWERIQRYFWNADRGMFFDYDFQTGARSNYEYATTFYPLWAGLATPEQAQAVVRNLGLFEQPGGLAMSRKETKAQWDHPYGWAPIQLITFEGLQRYGFQEEANRVAEKFLSMVLENFHRDRTIREKYNVVTRSSETQVEAGYPENVVGFGWTNGVFLELLHALPKDAADRLAKQ